MHSAAAPAVHPTRSIAQARWDTPQRYVAEIPNPTSITVVRRLPTSTTPRSISSIRTQLGDQAGGATSDRPDLEPLHLYRRFDQTFHQHESPLKYERCFSPSKYLTGLMLFNHVSLSYAPILERSPSFYGRSFANELLPFCLMRLTIGWLLAIDSIYCYHNAG